MRRRRRKKQPRRRRLWIAHLVPHVISFSNIFTSGRDGGLQNCYQGQAAVMCVYRSFFFSLHITLRNIFQRTVHDAIPSLSPPPACPVRE